MADFTAQINLDINDSKLSDVEKRIQDLDRTSHPINISIDDQGKIKDVSDKLNALTKNPIKIKLDISDQKLQSLINIINTASAAAGRSGGNIFTQNFTKSINAPLINKQLGLILNNLSSKGAGQPILDEVSKRMDTLIQKGIQINKITETFNKDNNVLSLKIDGVDELGDAVTLMERFNQKTGEWQSNTKFTNVLNDTAKQAREAAKELRELQNAQRKVADGDYRAQYSKMSASLSRYDTNSSDANIQHAISLLRDYKAEMDRIATIDPNIDATAYLDAARNIETYGKRFSNAMTIVDSTIGKAVNAHKRMKLEADITGFMEKNSRAMKKYKTELEELKRLASTAQTEADYKNVYTQFSATKAKVNSEGLTGKSFVSSLSSVGSSFLAKFLSVQKIIETSVRVAKEMTQAVIEIDTAMTSLYKVTNNTSEEYAKFTNYIKDTAVELGRTTSSLIEQSAEWAKLGYTLEEAQELAKVSSIYANVGEVDDKTAVSDIVTVLKAYEMQSTDAMSVVDMLNELGKYLPLYIVIYRSKSSYIG